MNQFVNYLLYGWYPYVAITVLILGSIMRFNRDQYGWRAKSSQMLRRRELAWGSNLFHIGVLVLLVGHFVGLLTPISVFDALGITRSFKQITALSVGGSAGAIAFIGSTILLQRRLADPRIRRTSSIGDIGVLTLIWLQIAVGLATIFWSIDHLDGQEVVLFMGWANGILTLNPSAADLIIDAHFVYKLHIVIGLTLFLVMPFSRLVHIWSAPVWYLGRKGYQIVRTHRPIQSIDAAGG